MSGIKERLKEKRGGWGEDEDEGDGMGMEWGEWGE